MADFLTTDVSYPSFSAYFKYFYIQLDTNGYNEFIKSIGQAVNKTTTDKGIQRRVAEELVQLAMPITPFRNQYRISKENYRKQIKPKQPNESKEDKTARIAYNKEVKKFNDLWSKERYVPGYYKYFKHTVTDEEATKKHPAGDVVRKRHYATTRENSAEAALKANFYVTEYNRENVYMDRPPHLRNSYKIVMRDNMASIRYFARKKANKHFSDSDGAYYGRIQYEGKDINWDRFTPNTTSYWLQVAIGEPVPSNVAGATVDATGNKAKLISIYNTELRKLLNK